MFPPQLEPRCRSKRAAGFSGKLFFGEAVFPEKPGPRKQEPQGIRRLHGQHPILGGLLKGSDGILVKRPELHPLDRTETCDELIGLADGANGNRLAVQDDLERRPQRRVGN